MAVETRKTNDLGPVGERVAENVATLRTERERISTYELSRRLEAEGRPIQPSGITKIENKTRKVDVGDLVALAVSLNVTPNRLLLPLKADHSATLLTPSTYTTAKDAWAWATDGELPSVWFPWDHQGERLYGDDLRRRQRRFTEENNPPRSSLTFKQGAPHLARIVELAKEVNRLAAELGVGRRALLETLGDLDIARGDDDGER